MKILTVIGARPQFIKAAAFSAKVADNDKVSETIIHTGQHFDDNMSDVFFNELNIPKPKYNLGINSLMHGAMTGRMLEQIEKIIIEEKPNWVLVYGDTNSTLAGALAAKKLDVKVAHVEAGLRSYNELMPEEINRVITDRLSSALFCPTQAAVVNLEKEGIRNMNILIKITGDIMKESMDLFAPVAVPPSFDIPDKFILGSLHRQENTDNIVRLKSIIEAYNEISKDITVVIPLHPRTLKTVSGHGLKFDNTGVKILPPVSYLEIIWLLSKSSLVITDSGGLQKEAYYNKKYCITTRDETEWTELVDHKVNFIASANKSKIIEFYKKLINKPFEASLNIYGKGNASEIILETLMEER